MEEGSIMVTTSTIAARRLRSSVMLVMAASPGASCSKIVEAEVARTSVRTGRRSSTKWRISACLIKPVSPVTRIKVSGV